MTQPFVVMHPNDFKVLRRWVSLPKDEAGRYLAVYRATDDPTELPDDEIIPDEARPLEDEPVKTDQVPQE